MAWDVEWLSLGGQWAGSMNDTKPVAMVRHRFNVWVDVPAVSGDGWAKYPDYSAEDIGRQMRRVFHDNGWEDRLVVVEHGETVEVVD